MSWPVVVPSDARAVSRLVIDATTGITDVVEEMHAAIARQASVPDTPVHAAVRGITGLVYGSVRAVTRLVGAGVDAAFATLGTTHGARRDSEAREAALAVLNGVLGDHLAETGNPLAIPMRLRRDGREVHVADLTDAGPRVLLLVHGLCMNDRQWTGETHDHGAALARDLGYTVLHVHYNSGRHVSQNGRQLAVLLEEMVRAWPVPVEELSILAHSMGGLLARSACHYGALAGHGWPGALRRVVFLGTPHHGSPVERGGNWIDTMLRGTAVTAPLGRLGRLRSAGVTDLRYGNVVDEDWQGRDRFARGADRRRPVPLPEGVAFYAVAAASRGRHPAGDGLVPVASALGRHRDRHLALRIPPSRRVVVRGVSHLGLLRSAAVYAQVRDWLRE